MSSIAKFGIFESEQLFRDAFNKELTKDVVGKPSQGQVIKQMPCSYGFLGVRFAKETTVHELEFFEGRYNKAACSVHTQIERIRVEVLKAIQEEKEKVVIPYCDQMQFFAITDKVVNIFDKTCLDMQCHVCASSEQGGISRELYDAIVKPAFEGLLKSHGCSISYDKTITQLAKPIGQNTTAKEMLFPTFEITLAEDDFGFFPRPIKAPDSKLMSDCLVEAYKKGELCDFSIQGKDGVVKAHKLMLALSLPYFKALTSGFKEATDNNLVLDDCSKNSIRAVVDFVYTGLNPFEIIRDSKEEKVEINAFEVLDLSNRWDLATLKIHAANEIAAKADASEFQEIADVAKKYEIPYLEKVSAYLKRKAELQKMKEASGSSSKDAKPQASQPAKAPDVLPLDED